MDFREKAAAVQSIVTSIAFVVGGIWAMHKFKLKRDGYPKAKTSHKLTVIDFDEKQRFVRLDLSVENVGEKLLRLRKLTVIVQQVLPLAPVGDDSAAFVPIPCETKREIGWPELHRYDHFFPVGTKEVEPGESETIQCDFVLAPEIKVVQTYSYVTNPAKWTPMRLFGPKGEPSEIGWQTTELHVLTPLSVPAPTRGPESAGRTD
jgi:hypothetical protein